MFPKPLIPHSVVDFLRRGASQHPNQIALLIPGSGASLTYESLRQSMDRSAAWLQTLDLQPGDRVVIYAGKDLDSVVLLLAILAARFIAVPLNPGLRANQIGQILDDAAAAAFIAPTALVHDLVATNKALPKHTYCTGSDTMATPPGTFPLELPSEDAEPVGTVLGSDLAMLLYTSGSTGAPKGVMITHHNLVYGADSVATYLGLRSDDRILALMPFGFDYGLNQLFSGLKAGAAVVLMDYLLPMDVLRTCADHGVTVLPGVPPVWVALSRLAWPSTLRGQLRCLTNTGGAMPVAVTRSLRAALPSARLYLMYGLTEAFRSTYLDPDLVDQHPDSIGRAVPHARISVRHSDGSLCAADEVGELVHEGPLVSAGYWRNPEATALRFRRLRSDDPTPAVWSGDLVTLGPDKLFRFVGRNDEMIKTSGHRVSPTEVEAAACATGLAKEAIAFGEADPRLGQAITLVATMADNSEGALRRRLATELPAWMMPRRVIAVQDLPRTSTGKPDRTAVRAQHAKPQGPL